MVVSDMKNPNVSASPCAGWKPGPLPPGTYGWGGVQVVGRHESGFSYADFCGDHVKLEDGETIKPEQVNQYNNCLDLPPGD